MGLRINTNTASLTAQRNLSNTTEQLQRSMARLSSGLRITRASDDAAGLAISERFRAEVRGLQQAQRNALDGISMLQIAEGALNEVSNNLIRMRELAMQAANGTLGTAEQTILNDEFQDLILEIERVADGTEFNGTKMLNDASTSITFQVGTGNTAGEDQITVSAVDAQTASGLSLDTLALSGADAAAGQAAAQGALTVLDTAINTISTHRAAFGTAQNRLESTVRSIAVMVENTSAAESRIRDVDVALETANLTKNQVLQQAGISVLAQANVSSQSALALLQ